MVHTKLFLIYGLSSDEDIARVCAIGAFSFKPGLRESQLKVKWSVTFLYSLVVERRC